MFKHLVAFVGSFILMGTVFAQNQPDSRPVYQRFPTVPQFEVEKISDGNTFTRENLKKKTNTVFFIFSPDCKYCQQETEDIIKHLKDFKNTQILMISHYPVDEVKAYYKQYKLEQYPQIVVAHDDNYFFPIFFDLKNLPSTFVYDKKGKLKKSFDGSVKVETILQEL